MTALSGTSESVAAHTPWGDVAAWLAGVERDTPDWTGALCRETDPDLWFPDVGKSTRQAKSVCQVCPLRQQCLDYAMGHDERFGVWGGLSERERRRIRRANNRGVL